MDTGSNATVVAHVCPSCQAHYFDGTRYCPKDGARLAPATETGEDPRIGQILDQRYRIVRKLGEGGMGEVYEAAHVYIAKKFAIKLLRPEVTSNADTVARFHQEARTASSIGHENIVAVDDFGRLPDGGVYLAMELLAGRSLADRLKEGPLPWAELLGYFLQICDGLAAAHHKGVIHRDMKPENVFLAERGGALVAKIFDFGIAKMAAGDGPGSLTRTGTVFGTPYYMSPEQALGKPLDPRTDVYSLGVILYQLTTGEVPYDAETFMGILTQHVTANLEPPSARAPERRIPPALEAVVMRAMAREPAARFQSVDELAGALEAVAAVEAPALLAERHRDGKARSPSPALLPAEAPGSAPDGTVDPLAATVPDPTPPPKRELDRDEVPAGLGAARRNTVLVAVAALAVALLAVLVWSRGRSPRPPPRGDAVRSRLIVDAGLPKTTSLVIDSEPAGAQIVVAGRVIGETPDVVQLPVGKPLAVTLRRTGYEDRSLLLDAAQGRKVMVRLERQVRVTITPPRPPAKKRIDGAPPSTSPPPPATTAPKGRTRPGTPQPIDPY